jgi:hypothetical protein
MATHNVYYIQTTVLVNTSLPLHLLNKMVLTENTVLKQWRNWEKI